METVILCGKPFLWPLFYNHMLYKDPIFLVPWMALK